MDETRALTLGEWMLTLLVLAIPLVNLFAYLYWALADGVNVNRKRFSQASILWFLIVAGIGMFMAVTMGIFGGLMAFS